MKMKSKKISAFDILIDEHRVIEIALNALSEMITHIMTNRKLQFFHGEYLVNFFRNYADKFHHCKEEDCLFDIVSARGLQDESDYIKDLQSDHVKGRDLVKGMDVAFREAAHGNWDMMMKFSQNGREYIDLLRAHILKEDRIFFPILIESFSADEMKKLEESFRKVEVTEIDETSGKSYPDIANELALIYNVDTSEIPEAFFD